MKRTTLLTLAASSLFACFVAANARSTQSHATPAGNHARAGARRLPQPGELNVLMIVLDDWGTDQLSMYAVDPGPPSNCTSTQVSAVSTPQLDFLRAQGVLFSRCYVDPVCSPTRATLMTGRHGMRTGMGTAVNPGDVSPFTLSTSEVCIADLIRDSNTAAYRRAAFGKWHVSSYYDTDCHPTDFGFEKFEGMMGNPESHYAWRKVSDSGGGLGGCTSTLSQDLPLVAGSTPSETFWDAGVARQDAEDWINGLSPAEPFFAYVAFCPPHAPQEVPPFRTISAATQARLSYLGYEAGDRPRTGQPGDVRLIFHAMMEGLDWEIGRLLADISPTVLAKTMVVVIDDNGTSGEVIANAAMSNHGKRTVYDLGTRVPMLVNGPLVGAHAGETCRSLVSGVDLWRTVANITGISNATIDAAMTGVTLDSLSFLDLIENPSGASARSFAYSETFSNGLPPPVNPNYKRGITDGSYRYMRISDQLGNVTPHLYHTEIDPCEQSDLLDGIYVLTGADLGALTALSTAMDSL
jgi:arylsulfatase A-like enzyme